ncbi:MAG: amidase family protein [Prochloraceae cyanobacterium]|nr:amidase family protein [Prochloraceae cyanobacterium]
MNIRFTPAHKLAEMIRNREISALETLEAYLQQIEQHNGKLNAIVTLDAENARKRAKQADEALARGENWGVLHGVPITIKDNLETAGLGTTGGYKPLKDYIPKQDATTVARLKAAGAIVFAKTNMPVLGGDYQSNNPMFGRTNNPWNLDLTVGGSSGGSAGAIAAGFSALELGSDIGGSIRVPAHYCGVFGFMPTDRRVPTTGHIPPLPGQADYVRNMLRVGPIGRSIEDLKLSFAVIAGADKRQPQIPPLELDRPTEKKISDLRIAWTYGFELLQVSQDTRLAIEKLINNLSNTGCYLEECNPTDLNWEDVLANYGPLCFMELFVASSSSIAGFLAGMLTTIRTEFTAFTQTKFKSGTPLAKNSHLVLPPSLDKYATILTERDRLIAIMDRFMDRWDAWICPVSMTPAFSHRSFGKPIEVDGVKYPYLLAAGGYTMPLNVTGSPVAVIPIGQTQEGLPIGIQIVGKRWQDMELLTVAEQINQAVGSFSNPPHY